MVVLYFSVKPGTEQTNLSMREFADMLKRTILANDQKKIVSIDVNH